MWLISILYLQGGGRPAADSPLGPAAAGQGAGVSIRRPGSANQRRDSIGTGRWGVWLDSILRTVGGMHLIRNLIVQSLQILGLGANTSILSINKVKPLLKATWLGDGNSGLELRSSNS